VYFLQVFINILAEIAADALALYQRLGVVGPHDAFVADVHLRFEDLRVVVDDEFLAVGAHE
jgi:hypothetical protein